MKKRWLIAGLGFVLSSMAYASDAPVQNKSVAQNSGQTQQKQPDWSAVRNKADKMAKDVEERSKKLAKEAKSKYHQYKNEAGPKTHQEIKNVQAKLKEMGYKLGQIDGKIGARTHKAIRRFQADHGLPQTGKLSPEMLKALFH
ncbi:putative peptidoglycan binding protein [Celerinatantimonas diazotrophica]|uniref:Putative peptidoglycan binding protein n=2 Tax=Celerinatantimonas diazotrophica TaxID=412034 RepID=A0A4R1JLK4_9GAMM|nr:putative peptidoglycan binding protein [Celerinatantimonas diazotrophica]CAG9296363.1 hypothetical protein CEDIAZO_01512 [Celerinatantimonas diazotrophica]